MKLFEKLLLNTLYYDIDYYNYRLKRRNTNKNKTHNHIMATCDAISKGILKILYLVTLPVFNNKKKQNRTLPYIFILKTSSPALINSKL